MNQVIFFLFEDQGFDYDKVVTVEVRLCLFLVFAILLFLFNLSLSLSVKGYSSPLFLRCFQTSFAKTVPHHV